MNPTQRRSLFTLKFFVALCFGLPLQALGFAARFVRDRFHAGWEAEYDWWNGMQQQRETYQIDDEIAGRRA